jgi:hypothetical protein
LHHLSYTSDTRENLRAIVVTGISLIRIYADFNNQDAYGRVQLIMPDSLTDLTLHQNQLRTGVAVILYTQPEDYVEVDAVLVYDDQHSLWLADWSAYRDR